ncbi:hypothetical protein [Pseudomonas yamanorum]|uniref:Uncharacterized protein n=1 Tax=Pseudomonas yamanorum TaxID=515393 RepID=A0A7Y8EDC3_9PSED|nr:hypothetical protein [Pseudomonas yamanorum]NWE77210.1 hypothetical protein [Pseudomonas yamanorum]
MLTFEIIPLDSIGPLKLGATRVEVREAMRAIGFPLESARKALDYFHHSCIQTESDADGNVQFIGISSSPEITVSYKGLDVYSIAAPELFSLLAEHDASGPHVYNTYEYLFPNQVITLWDADEQYDRQGEETRPVWAQVGIGNSTYVDAMKAIK